MRALLQEIQRIGLVNAGARHWQQVNVLPQLRGGARRIFHQIGRRSAP